MKNLLAKLSVIVLTLGPSTAVLAVSVLTSVTVGGQAPSSITAGNSASYTVTISRTGSGSMDVYLSCLNLPAGATASFSPSPVAFFGSAPASSTSTLVITTTNSMAAGTYNFTVQAQVGGSHNIQTNTATLTVGSDGKTTLAAQNITSLQMLGDGSASVALHAAPSKSYVLQATTTLSPAAWVNISTNATDTSGDCILLDSTASAFASRFYRTTLLN